MKTLTLLRHAKSADPDWDAGTRDFDRALNAKGRRAAAAMGAEMRRLGLRFDRVVASPALRVAQTLEAAAGGYDAPLRPEWERRVYMASDAALMDLVREQPDEAERVLLVGHNPGLEDLVLLLVPEDRHGLRDAVEEKYPTATLAELTLPCERWADAGEGAATLTRLIRPRDLDPALGPDGG